MRFSGYSLRVLLYLATYQDRLVSISEVSGAYGVSHHRLVKVVQRLLERDLIASTLGRGGGLRLNRLPAAINIGALVRATEPHFDLVECFDREANTCPIDPACGLKGVLRNAQAACGPSPTSFRARRNSFGCGSGRAVRIVQWHPST